MKEIKTLNHVAIFYFTGTGNTLFISECFKKQFLKKNKIVELIPIESIDTTVSLNKYDLIMIGSPIHAFKTNILVSSFVKNLPKVMQKPVILFATAGGFFGNGLQSLEKVLLKKGYDVRATLEYKMPSNWNRSNDYKDDLKYLDENLQKINLDFMKINNDNYLLIKKNILITFFSNFGNFFFRKFMLHKKMIINYNDCSFCGLCENVCPTKNILIKHKKKKIIFDKKCVLCGRCINFCPNNAIYFKKINKKKNYKYDNFIEKF